MKFIAGIVLAGAVAAGVAVVSGGGNSLFPSGKVPGKDYPYGEGVVYRRGVLFGSHRRGFQEGPGPQIELIGSCPRSRSPNGDWYIVDQDVNHVVYKYDLEKNRAWQIAWAGPWGCQGGLAECARFGGGGYHRGMGVGADGKCARVFDRANGGITWRIDLEKGTVAPAPGADKIKGAVIRGAGESGAKYFAHDDAKLKKMLPDGTVQDTGVTLQGPLRISTFFGAVAVNEKLGRMYATARDPRGPFGIVWYWDMKTGKAHWIAGPKKGQDAKGLVLGSGPCDKIKFWCAGGLAFGPDRGERYLYLGGGDESTCSRIDLEKKYVHKLVKADPKGDRSLWHFADGRQNKEYRFGDPYKWSSSTIWGSEGEFYMTWALSSMVDVYRPVKKQEVRP